MDTAGERGRKALRQDQRRRARSSRAAGAQRRGLLIRGAVIGVVLVALFLGLRALGVFEPPTGIDVDSPAYQVPPGEQVGTKVPSEGNGHAPTGQRVTYGTVPPSSGRHWGQTVPWGIKDTQEPDERVVHNLEHGGVLIAYNGLAPNEVERLRSLVRALRGRYPKIVLEPYPGLGDAKVGVTAWSWHLRLASLDEAQIVRFVKAHYQGPDAPEPRAG